MSARALAVAAVLAAAAVVTPAPTASAKDDPAAIKAMREKVRAEYKAAKKYPFADLKFFLDFPKMKDQRWEVKDHSKPVEDPEAPGGLLAADFPSGNANDPAPSIHCNIQRWPYYNLLGGGQRQPNAMEFKSWGRTVQMQDWELLVEGFYQDWVRASTDVIKEKCKVPDKKGAVGPAKVWGYATATDKESKKRERHDWYGWTTTDPPIPMTYLVQFTVSDAKFADNEEWMAKIPEFMKNIKELKDSRLK